MGLPFNTLVFVGTMVTFVILAPSTTVVSRIGRVWLFKLDKETEEKRTEACRIIKRHRAAGQIVRVCERCGGTGSWGWLSFTWPCRKCRKRGYYIAGPVKRRDA